MRAALFAATRHTGPAGTPAADATVALALRVVLWHAHAVARAAPALAPATAARWLDAGILPAMVQLRLRGASPQAVLTADDALLHLAAASPAAWAPHLARVPGLLDRVGVSLGADALWRRAAWAVLVGPASAAPSAVDEAVRGCSAALDAGDAEGVAGVLQGLLPLLATWQATGSAGAAAALSPTAPLGQALARLQTHAKAVRDSLPAPAVRDADADADAKEPPEVRAAARGRPPAQVVAGLTAPALLMALRPLLATAKTA